MKKIFILPVSDAIEVALAKPMVDIIKKHFDTNTYQLIIASPEDLVIDSLTEGISVTCMGVKGTFNKSFCYNKAVKDFDGDFYIFLNPREAIDDKFLDFNFADLKYDINIFDSTRKEGVLDLDGLLAGYFLYDAVVCKRALKEKLGYWFEDYYAPVEMFRFCLNAASHGLSVGTVGHKMLADESGNGVPEKYVKKLNKVYKSRNEGDLTCILSFINEKHEVERTVNSIRYMSNGVKILLVNDCSDDGFDYKSIAKKYNCDYVDLPQRIGSAGGKNVGGFLAKSKYMCFFDAHMRLYREGWDTEVIGYLKEHPQSIIAPRSIYLGLDNDGFVTNENGLEGNGHRGLSACCSMVFQPSYEFDPKWTDIFVDENPKNKLSPVPCVLGAVYAMETDWWKKIHGFNGLQVYGLEESLMSLKTFLFGGTCYVIKDWGVGHIYRKYNSAPINPRFVDANRIFLTHLFREDKYEEYKKNLEGRIGVEKYAESEKIYNALSGMMEKEREYVKSNSVRTIEDFLEFDKKVAMKDHKQYII